MDVRTRAGQFPTVLVAISVELRHRLVGHLTSYRCHVLEADGEEEILRIVIKHSRPIHALLVDVTATDPQFLRKLAKYRPSMELLAIDSEDQVSAHETVLSWLKSVLS